MQHIDLKPFEQTMGELAECYDRKALSPSALKHWFEALKPFSWHKVETHLRQWITSKPRFPAISDIYQSINDCSIGERETSWQAAKEAEKRETAQFVKSAQGEKVFAMLRGFLGKTAHDPKAWAHRILDAWADNRPLRYINPGDGKEYDIEYEALDPFGRLVMVPAIPQPYAVKCACEALGVDYAGLMQSRRRVSREETSGNEIAMQQEEPGAFG